MKKNIFYIWIAISIIFMGIILTPRKTLADWDDYKPYVPEGLQDQSLQGIISAVISAALLLAGVVAVAYLIVGGYKYITSSGNAEQAESAKTTITNSIIGLIVIFAAYVIVKFVLNAIDIS